MVAGWVGDVLFAQIVDTQPLLLMALNPRNRYLALATNELDAVPYYVVGFARLVLTDPINYLLGFWFGDRAVAWAENRSSGRLNADTTRLFRKVAYPLIFFAPNNLICALAGATGVRVGAFVALDVTGTIVRLILVRVVGEAFSSPIGELTTLITRYRVPIIIVSVIGVAWTIIGEVRGNNSSLKQLTDLAADADGESDSDERTEPASDQETTKPTGD